MYQLTAAGYGTSVKSYVLIYFVDRLYELIQQSMHEVCCMEIYKGGHTKLGFCPQIANPHIPGLIPLSQTRKISLVCHLAYRNPHFLINPQIVNPHISLVCQFKARKISCHANCKTSNRKKLGPQIRKLPNKRKAFLLYQNHRKPIFTV